MPVFTFVIAIVITISLAATLIQWLQGFQVRRRNFKLWTGLVQGKLSERYSARAIIFDTGLANATGLQLLRPGYCLQLFRNHLFLAPTAKVSSS